MASDTFTAGVAVGDITPALPVALAGYGDREGVAHEVHDPLSVRAVVLEGPGVRLALVVLDLLLLAPERAGPIRRAVADRLAVTTDAVLTACVHVHGGPSTVAGGEDLGWPEPAGYVRRVAEVAADAAAAAASAAVPVRARFGRADLAPGVAVNRRGHSFEPSLAALDLLAADDGRRVASVVSLGMHPTVSGPRNLTVSTDWVGPCRAALEAEVGGTVVVVQGCGGDVNPAVTAWDDGDPRRWGPAAAEVGASVAATARRALVGADDVSGPLVQRDVRRLTVPLDPETLLASLVDEPDRQVELHEWHLGDMMMVNVPGEGFHHLEQAVRAGRGDRVLLVGLAPDWHGYLPVPFEEGYEESLSFGRRAVSRLGAALAAPADDMATA